MKLLKLRFEKYLKYYIKKNHKANYLIFIIIDINNQLYNKV